jgi:general secretion pathway protein B
MSFILDALKKSESDRQQQASAEFATLPSAAAAPAMPRWIWAVIALLVVNVAVLGAFMTRKDADIQAAGPAPVPATQTAADTGTRSSFAERISKASVPARSTPAPAPTTREPAPAQPVTAPTAARQEPVRVAAPAPLPATSAQALPTLNEVRLNDNVNLPDLHLDIHVYAGAPADRFVFINMSKHQEGSVLKSGPRVEEITPDGVILDYRGTRFVLPRE